MEQAISFASINHNNVEKQHKKGNIVTKILDKKIENDTPNNISHHEYYEYSTHMTVKDQVHNKEQSNDLTYEQLIDAYDHEIRPTKPYVRKFIKGIVENIDVYTNKQEQIPTTIDINKLSDNIADSLPKKMYYDEYLKYCADYLVGKSSDHYYYDIMSSHIEVIRLHSITFNSFDKTIDLLQNNYDINKDPSPILSYEAYTAMKNHIDRIQKEIDYKRDFTFDYFGLKTLERSYLSKLHYTKYKIVERPQHLFMRVAFGIHHEDVESAIETYHYLSNKYFTHATPTLFNAGCRVPQMSSCFLVSVDDSIDDIFNAIKEMANISKYSGGIGAHISAIRAKGSLIRGTNGLSSGIIPLCVTLNKLAKYINQGGKRNGSIACFVKDTEVFTINDGPKHIQDVQIGDVVVTHKNRLRRVTQVHKNKLGDRKIYKLEIEKNKNIYVTGNHNLWSSYTGKSVNSFGWNSVEHLKSIMENKTMDTNCYASSPLSTDIDPNHGGKINIFDNKNDKIPREEMIITENLAIVLGLWFGQGSIRKSQYDNSILGISFTIDKYNTDLVTLIKQTCESICPNCAIIENTYGQNSVRIIVESLKVGIVFSELFNVKNDNHIKSIPNIAFTWSKLIIENFLAGYIISDGYITKKNDAMIGTNSSIANKLYHVSRNNGILASVINSNTKYNDEMQSSICIPLNNRIASMVKNYCYKITDEHAKIFNIEGDANSLKILEITETDRNDEYVYTLGIEDDHSYTVEGIIVENCYLEPWHADVYDFCELRKNISGDRKDQDVDNRAYDLFLALWVPSLFIKRVLEDGMWSLMCPDECPNLHKTHSEEFEKLYTKYESEGRYKRQVKARDLWKHILVSQIETGFPYILYKDNANKKSNQQNLGTIRSSNLCAEIIEYSDENETAVCNLCSICLPKYIKSDGTNKYYDYDELIKVCRLVVRNLNKVIDLNYYPSQKTFISNKRHRPVGIGVQGLADTYNLMGYGFDSAEAELLNKKIFETIYYACLDESKELAKKYGKYDSFNGSPFSEGKLQFHLWGISEDSLVMKNYDWKKLISEIMEYGTRNSLLTALMPTASTSQIMGNSECIEPYMSNIFKRSTLAGEFIVVNKNLMKELIKKHLWNDDMRKLLIINNGSVQNIPNIPENIKAIYKTAFEMGQNRLVKQSVDRGIFIDQSQSFNLFIPEPNFQKLSNALIDGHNKGIKTGMYYYRTLPAVNPINFGIDVDDIKRLTGKNVAVDLISGDYKFEDNNNNKRTKKSEKKDDPVMCKWKPGMRVEDCSSCGS